MGKTIHVIEKVEKRAKDKRKKDVFKIWNEEGYVDFNGMVNELHKRTHMPRWICEKIYECEDSILEDLGILSYPED